MPEVRDRLERIGNQVPFPEDAFERLTRRRKRREITRRFGIVLLALAVAGVGVGGAVTTLRHSAKPAAHRQVQVPLWPDIEELSSTDLRACCSTPKETAESFARTVLRWRLPVVDVSGPGADSITVHRDCAA